MHDRHRWTQAESAAWDSFPLSSLYGVNGRVAQAIPCSCGAPYARGETTRLCADTVP